MRLDQVATVSRHRGRAALSAALLNGKPVVGFEIVRSRGAGEVGRRRRRARRAGQAAGRAPRHRVTEAFNFVDPVVENFDGSMWLLYRRRGARRAGGLAVPARLARHLVSATALPLSVIPTFAVMYLFGFTLNVVTLLSAVAGGRHPGRRRHRRDREHHAPPAHGQDALPGGDGGGRRDRPGGDRHHLHADRRVPAHRLHERRAGKFFVQFGWTAAIAVFFSLVVARMLTPMMAAYILKPPKKDHHEPRWLKVYGGWAAGA
jgi:multidrug efflux pump subunit AcrB